MPGKIAAPPPPSSPGCNRPEARLRRPRGRAATVFLATTTAAVARSGIVRHAVDPSVSRVRGRSSMYVGASTAFGARDDLRRRPRDVARPAEHGRRVQGRRHDARREFRSVTPLHDPERGRLRDRRPARRSGGRRRVCRSGSPTPPTRHWRPARTGWSTSCSTCCPTRCTSPSTPGSSARPWGDASATSTCRRGCSSGHCGSWGPAPVSTSLRWPRSGGTTRSPRSEPGSAAPPPRTCRS